MFNYIKVLYRHICLIDDSKFLNLSNKCYLICIILPHILVHIPHELYHVDSHVYPPCRSLDCNGINITMITNNLHRTMYQNNTEAGNIQSIMCMLVYPTINTQYRVYTCMFLAVTLRYVDQQDVGRNNYCAPRHDMI